MRRRWFGLLVGLLVAGLGLVGPGAGSAVTVPPRFDHVVIVMEENHSFNDIIGSSSAPYINGLAAQGALFADSFAVTHPSQPNYVALFSGSTQGLTSDSCPHTFTANNVGNQLRAAGFSFTGYSEGLPADGSTVCTSGEYARKHSPWTNFSDLPATVNTKFSEFPTDLTTLPTVSFVIPNLLDDMHDGTVAEGDTWLRDNIDAYVQWATAHNSLLIVTWDEDDNSMNNQIPTLFVGAHVTPGKYTERVTHYNVLRTLQDAYGLAPLGNSATATPITDVWQP
ncbi:MAG TPA: alkaline phosphatase family protein [Pseudonocardiaceae bacterium]|nr:alkaline phosphatase family protein [Pseudonocardiaceae bacterium]